MIFFRILITIYPDGVVRFNVVDFLCLKTHLFSLSGHLNLQNMMLVGGLMHIVYLFDTSPFVSSKR